jgi:hypothetical protein
MNTKIKELLLLILFKQKEIFEKENFISKESYIDFVLKENLIGLKEREINEWEKEHVVYEFFKQVYSGYDFVCKYESLKKLNEDIKILENEEILKLKLSSEKINKLLIFFYLFEYDNLYFFEELPLFINMRLHELHFWVLNGEINDNGDFANCLKKFQLKGNNEDVKDNLIEIFRKIYETVALN